MITHRYAEAAAFAAQCHHGQVRKGAGTPYIAHPMAVSALVLAFGGDEDQAIGALLHDVVEDCGVTYGEIRRRFGGFVAEIVGYATDGVPDGAGRKEPWKKRKTAYLEQLLDDPAPALLVIACDKLNNAESIAADLDGEAGVAVFERFTATAAETAWYYREIAGIMIVRGADLPPDLVARMVRAVARIQRGAEEVRTGQAAELLPA